MIGRIESILVRYNTDDPYNPEERAILYFNYDYKTGKMVSREIIIRQKNKIVWREVLEKEYYKDFYDVKKRFFDVVSRRLKEKHPLFVISERTEKSFQKGDLR